MSEIFLWTKSWKLIYVNEVRNSVLHLVVNLCTNFNFLLHPLGIILKMIGPSLTASLDAKADADNAAIDQIQKDEMAKYKVAIEEQKEAQVMASSYEELIQAKKEAVGLQLEAEYRSRLQNAYSQVNFNPVILGKSVHFLSL